MRNEVIKKISLDSWNMCGEFRRSVIMFRVDHESHMVEFEQINEIAPTWDSFVNLLLADKDCFAELAWFRHNNLRNNDIYIDYHEGRSGCKRATLYSYRPTHHKWAKGAKRAKMGELYVSCNDKLELPEKIFFDDLLDLVHTIECRYANHRLWYAPLNKAGQNFLEILDSGNPLKRDRFKYLKWDAHRPLRTTESVCGGYVAATGEDEDEVVEF